MAKVVVPLGPDFEDVEYSFPVDRLREAGHRIVVVGKKAGEEVTGKRGRVSVPVESAASDRRAEEFDAMLIPGGYSPDQLRTDPGTVRLVKDFVGTGKPVAAVCHGPQLLIEADAVRNKTVTSWPSVRKDLENAGARWVDEQVVQDGSFITSRKPDDLDAFTRTFISRL